MSCNPLSRKIHGPVVKEFLFENSNTVILSVQSNSMYPILKKGQTLAVNRLDGKAVLKPGGLYVFLLNGILAIHRFAVMHRGKALFSGDNSASIEHVARIDIVGYCNVRHQPVFCWCVNKTNLIIAKFPFTRTVLFYLKKALVTIMEVIYEKKL
jgi:hypothetical protein